MLNSIYCTFTYTMRIWSEHLLKKTNKKDNVIIEWPTVSVEPQFKMDFSIVISTRHISVILLIFVSSLLLSLANCQTSRVKVVRPKSLEADARFNWSSVAENYSFPSEPLRFFEYAQLPVYQNERQPICDGNNNRTQNKILHNHFKRWNYTILILFVICLHKKNENDAVYRTMQLPQLPHELWEEPRQNPISFHGWLSFWLLLPIF